jgi:DNA processing protein
VARDAKGTPEREAWIALAATPGVGDVTFDRLLEVYGDASTALTEVARMPSGSDGRLARRLGIRIRHGIVREIGQMAASPSRPLEAMLRLGGWAMTPLDAEYPARLNELEQPPKVLYGIGSKRSLVSHRLVAVVGTRRPTALGRDLAMRVSTRLVEAGATVVSGLALGIDGVSHRATLEAGGKTIAVVGGGLDAPGPATHRRLAREIVGTGAIVGELAPGVAPTQGTFPRRNRLISALAAATIVIEAPVRSGALITARHALEQGRVLLVAPGRPLDKRIAGNLALLRESPARPLVGLDEMIADLGFDDARGDQDAPAGLTSGAALAQLGTLERVVATELIGGPRTVDALVASSGLPAGSVAGALTILQLRGWARVHGPMQIAAGPLLRDSG